jgi:hypothetical protein
MYSGTGSVDKNSVTVHTARICNYHIREKVGAARCEYVFAVHTSKASKRLKMVLLHLGLINVKTSRGFINIPIEDYWTNNVDGPRLL